MKFIIKKIEGKDFLEVADITSKELNYLKLYFSRKVKNWQFKKKAGSSWNGDINFFVGYRWLPLGLWKELVDYCKLANIDLEIEGLTEKFNTNIKKEEFKKFCLSLDFFKNPNNTIRDYQLDTAYKILKWKYSCAELATSAGKSFIMFLVSAWLKAKEENRKILIIVPNISLVEQMVEDFMSYDPENKLGFSFTTVFSGTNRKDKDSFITVSTFQSAVKKDKEYLSQFTDIFLDEAHRITAKSVRDVIDKCEGKNLICGLSGTLPKKEDATFFTIQQYTGPIIEEITANDLLKEGYVSPVKIKILKMDWLEQNYKSKLYARFCMGSEERKGLLNIEKKIITESPKRLDKVTEIISKIEGVSLVLFQDVKNGYGKRVQETLANLVEVPVHYIDGLTPKNERSEIIKTMKSGENQILVATYKTLGEGISIKPISHIFLVESYKSEEIVRQFVGRGLRLYKDKKELVIVDFVDDFSLNYENDGVNWDNYHIKHHKRRKEIYEEQKFQYKIYETKF